MLAPEPALRGIRHLIHEETDPHWILRAPVLESLAVVEERGLVLELPCVFPRHLGDLPELAQRFPALDDRDRPPRQATARHRADGRLVGAAPPGGRAPERLRQGIGPEHDARRRPTGPDRTCEAAVEVAVDCFGPDRLMCGSDWPVSLLNGDYDKVWHETVAAITVVAGGAAARRILEDTPARLYRIAEAPCAVSTTTTTGEAHGRAH